MARLTRQDVTEIAKALGLSRAQAESLYRHSQDEKEEKA